MAILGVTVARPHEGKRLTAENRARQLGGIYARHGASVKVSTIITGPNTGCIVVVRGYSDFRTAAKAFQAVNNDPAHAEFWREREANPAADIVIARDIYRRVYGEGQWSTHPVSQIDSPAQPGSSQAVYAAATTSGSTTRCRADAWPR